jgi:hypothetical protein
MPTVTEVEERLRRTAQACEPIVDELLVGEALPGPVDLRPRRRRATPWLAAAALVAVLVGAGLVVADDDPGPEVRTSTPPTLYDHTPTTADAAGNPLLATGVLLPDGTDLVLGIPGPDRWTAGAALVHVTVDGIDEPLAIGIQQRPVAEAVGEDGQIERELRPGAWITTDERWRWLAVEVDGWTATLPLVEDGDEVVPDAVAEDLASDLTFRPTPAGVVDLTASGLAVTGATRYLSAGGDPFAIRSGLAVTTPPDAGDLACPTPPSQRDRRCYLDDTVTVAAVGDLALPILPGVTVRRADEPPTPGDEGAPAVAGALPMALPDGTRLELSGAGSGGWVGGEARATVALDGVADAVQVSFSRLTREAWAEENDATLTATDEDHVSTAASAGLRWLLVEDGGWTAALLLGGATAPVTVPEEVVTRLVRTIGFLGTDTGPTDLHGSGVAVRSAFRTVADAGGGDLFTVGTGVHVGESCDDDEGLCRADGTVQLLPVGPAAEPLLADVEVLVTAVPD